MMVKGFIFFRDGKIPFVIENYHMELFTDDPLLDDFCKEYNFKENYILHGQCFDIGIRGRKATFLVENSMGSTCYLRCYTINMFDKDEEYDSIGLQSPSLDEVFRYEYEYIDMVRAGINLAIEPKVVYKVPLLVTFVICSVTFWIFKLQTLCLTPAVAPLDSLLQPCTICLKRQALTRTNARISRRSSCTDLNSRVICLLLLLPI